MLGSFTSQRRHFQIHEDECLVTTTYFSKGEKLLMLKLKYVFQS